VVQVQEDLLLEHQKVDVIMLLHEVVNMVTEDSKTAIGYCVSFQVSLHTALKALTKNKVDVLDHDKVRLRRNK
jgi:hypothetical protein